ncbi:ATP-dependent RNA helicase ded1 [Penicillium riverlandense]|uniref:ATP-dependent RNA helicase ded1 n=1 Tax=Penicillium riverlandense TaxID=1903569 RepID=UPI00254659C8|nr:ATP-dependent RNA helicase ded1 [Penicillium riverlandense]KAJ5820329.1 ATP-dependent RNA helicase ded1 [Penicillium riverlandense]
MEQFAEDSKPEETMETPAPAPPTTEDAARAAQEAGWTKPIPFNYDIDTKEVREWAAVAPKYEWKDEFGEVGPPVPELEDQLFRNDFITRVGYKLDALNAIDVTCESKDAIKPILDWKDAGLHPVMLENIQLCMYARPTPIQSYGVPAILRGHDLIGIAQTGCGKTDTFLIPILSKLMGKAKKLAAPRPYAESFDAATHTVRAEPLVLVVCPTRELATQIFDEARRLCYRSMLRPCVAYGGAPIRLQREDLQKGCDILIGTPGRILDFMNQPHVLSLRRVRYTVVDEADELLDSSWEQEFVRLMSGGDVNEDADHHYLMFSATFNKACRKLARTYLGEEHVRIRIGRPGSTHINVAQQILFVEDRSKKQALYDLIMSMLPIRTLIFVNTKDQVDFVDDFLYNMGLPSTSIHSGRTQIEREDAIRAFRTAKAPVMATTSLSARGLDIANVMHVINYDLPRGDDAIGQYVHRIGRTARIGNEGLATSFYNDGDSDMGNDLVKILMETGQKIPDFLQHFTPSDNILVFDDDSNDSQDGDADEGNGTQGGGWGASEEPQNGFKEPLVDVASNSLGGSTWATQAQQEPTNNW